MRRDWFEPERNGVGVTAVDVLNTAVVVLLAVTVAILRHALGATAGWLLATFTALALQTAVLAFLSTRGRPWNVLHDFSPIVTLIAVFSTLGPIIEAGGGARWDLTFARLDVVLVGQLAGEWRALFGRPSWFVDLVYGLYLSYFFVPLALGILVYRRPSAGDFQSLAFPIILTFYLSYLGYFCFPTLGPRLPPEAEPFAIGGGVLSQWARSFLHLVEHNRTDAFPSGHTAVTLVCLHRAWRISARVAAICLPVVTGIIFATVYLHCHYVVDVLAGAVLGCGVVWLSPRLQLWCEPRAAMKRAALRLGIE